MSYEGIPEPDPGIVHEWEAAAVPFLIYYLRTRPRRSLVGEYGIVARRLRRYSSNEPDCPRNGYEGITWDTPNGLVLFCGEDPVACIGFDLFPELVRVRQIQGVYGMGPKLHAFPWERALLESVIAIAAAQHCPAIEVQPAATNSWNRGVGSSRERLFRQRYDDTARALGFAEPNETRRFYRLALA